MCFECRIRGEHRHTSQQEDWSPKKREEKAVKMRTHSAAGRTIGQGETVAVDVVKIKIKHSTITFVIWIYANLPFFFFD